MFRDVPSKVQGSRFLVLDGVEKEQRDSSEVAKQKDYVSDNNMGNKKDKELEVIVSQGAMNGNARVGQHEESGTDMVVIRDVSSIDGLVPLFSQVAVINVVGNHFALLIHEGGLKKSKGGSSLKLVGSSVGKGLNMPSNVAPIPPDDLVSSGDSVLISDGSEDAMEFSREKVETLSQ
ncbi:hypothetical protein V6N11_022357 [Hibiscus sabdariffa]|uniref:Uncharacterized protein n=1 Tax=Hibiscus sabdariffa TaxID=183260 RepID=A0ABR2TJB7_9ROSI